MNVVELARALHREAAATNERRLLVLAGDREEGYDALESILDALPIPISRTTLIGPDDRLRCEQLPQPNARGLLGTTRDVVILDAHDDLQPNALGAVVGVVDGGGLLILCTPSLESWPQRRTGFDESLAVPPFDLEDVTGRFRTRLVELLQAHRGIAILDLETGRVESNGRTNPAPRLSSPAIEASPPAESRIPAAAYDACYTQDQIDALAALESLRSGPTAIVLEADRGRGKSSAAGLAAGWFAVKGEDVLVTAPAARNAAEVFARARELIGELEGEEPLESTENGTLETDAGGRVRFLEPEAALEDAENADIVLVDEAAALPVSTLRSLLAADRIAFATTIHGYEGAGRGFSVRFRDRLEEGDHEVIDASLSEPIRYAAGDPLEVWAFRALLLDARPPVEQLVSAATPESVEYRRLPPETLLEDENLLREAFGLLVLAHYRTEPNDLARVLDAPNLELRALCHDNHAVSVALLAREGGLSATERAMMYEGGRIRGNMLPDVLTSQLRDEAGGEPTGVRVVRIATHHATRSRGLGSQLLECIHDEFTENHDEFAENRCGVGENRNEAAETIDWLGAGFGATPELVDFWADNGYSSVHVSTTRNDASGEYSALMLRPTSDAGQQLHDRHARWFARRFSALSSDRLSTLEPDVARAILRSVDATPPLSLSDHEWRVVAGAAYGPGLFDIDPGPFRRLIVRYLIEAPSEGGLSAREARLLVLRGLQGRDWPAVAERLEYHSPGQCMRALGEALCPLVDEYGGDAALEVRERFE